MKQGDGGAAIPRISIIILGILSILLIVIGWYLEVYYYYFRFATGDNVEKVVSIIIGVGLTLFLTLLYVRVNVNKILISIPIIIFSIFCTTTGQSFSLSQKDSLESQIKAKEENLGEQKEYYQLRIDELKIELEEEKSIIDVDLNSRMNANTNGVQPIKETIKEIKIDIKYYEELRDVIIDSMTTSNSVASKPMNTYILITQELKFLDPVWLKFYAQITLSLLIALMAPAGIMMLSAIKNSILPYKLESKQIQESKIVAKEIPVISKQENAIKKYADSRFRNEENPSTLKGRPEVIIETGLTNTAFNKITEIAKTRNLISINGKISRPGPFITRQIFIEKMING